MHINLELLAGVIYDAVLEHLSVLENNADAMANITAICVLSEIKDAVCNEDYSDFEVVEKIVCIFRDNHIDCGGRHDA